MQFSWLRRSLPPEAMARLHSVMKALSEERPRDARLRNWLIAGLSFESISIARPRDRGDFVLGWASWSNPAQ